MQECSLTVVTFGIQVFNAWLKNSIFNTLFKSIVNDFAYQTHRSTGQFILPKSLLHFRCFCSIFFSCDTEKWENPRKSQMFPTTTTIYKKKHKYIWELGTNIKPFPNPRQRMIIYIKIYLQVSLQVILTQNSCKLSHKYNMIFIV